MKPAVRRPRISSRLVFFLVMTTAVAVAFVYQPSGPTICSSKRVFNVSCPGCGMMRSVCAFAQGRFEESLNYHLFGPLVLGIMVTLWGISIYGLGRKRDYRSPDSPGFNMSLWVALVFLIAYWIARISTGTTP